MAYDARVYRILIASPSDVEEERDIASSVIQSWNDLHSYTRKVVLLPLRWETHTAPEYGTRPQEVINRAIVDECDLLVGIFWTRIGSPTGSADSGTLEEIERVGKAGKPVMLYFSRVAIDPDRIDTNQIESLKAFRKNTYPKGLVETYQKLSGFRDKFSRQLEITIRDLQKAESSGPIPLSLTFLSVQDGKSIGSDLKITYRRPIVSDFGAVPPDLVDEVKKMVENKIKRESFHPIALGIQNSGLTGIRNPYLKIEFTPDNVDLELSDNFPSRRSRWLTTRISKFWLSSQFVDLDDDDDGSGDDTVSKMKEIFQEFESESFQKLGEGWNLALEWDAIQPQRLRLVKPFLFVSSPKTALLTVHAKAYSDSFPVPYELRGTCSIEVVDVYAELSSVLPDWEKKARAVQAEARAALAQARDSGSKGSDS